MFVAAVATGDLDFMTLAPCSVEALAPSSGRQFITNDRRRSERSDPELDDRDLLPSVQAQLSMLTDMRSVSNSTDASNLSARRTAVSLTPSWRASSRLLFIGTHTTA
jgi:hypothetical protein